MALVVTLVLIGESAGGHSSGRRANQPSAAPASHATVPAAGQSLAVTGSTTSTTIGSDPYLLPDGSAQPLLAVFDGSTIDLTGAVPSAAIAKRLSVLAEAYSTTANARVVTKLVIDPRVPTSTGVRVMDLTATKFASGSSEVTPAYASEMNRVVRILRAMPQLTVTVVGHADQIGDAAQNLSLSEARSTAVVQYLESQGINPDRLSAQGVGQANPLTQQTDAAGLALNRRTEFIFYGLMAGT